MWHLQQRENIYPHATSLNHIGPQITSNTPQNGQFYNRRICKLGDETKTFKPWDMKWHWLRDKDVIEKLRVYWYKGTNKEADYFTKHESLVYAYLKFSEYNSSDYKIMRGCFEPIPR